MDGTMSEAKIHGRCSLASHWRWAVRDLRADVKLPNLISDGMVLQQGMRVNIWGTRRRLVNM
jgi:hypothetical protein